MYLFLKIMSVFLSVFLINGCSKQNLKVQPTVISEQPFYHVIKNEGETISIIAKWYTGDIENFEAILKTNPKLDPLKVTKGDSIKIPAELLIKREEMPKSFVDELSRSANPAKTIEDPKIEKNVTDSTPIIKEESSSTDELIKSRDDLWKELMGE